MARAAKRGDGQRPERETKHPPAQGDAEAGPGPQCQVAVAKHPGHHPLF